MLRKTDINGHIDCDCLFKIPLLGNSMSDTQLDKGPSDNTLKYTENAQKKVSKLCLCTFTDIM